MKRRILMVSAMILLLGSQLQMFAYKKAEPVHKKSGVVIVVDHKLVRPIGEAISQGDIARVQDFYWKKYRVRLSKKEAKRILIENMRDRGPMDFVYNPPPQPKGHKPKPRGPQRPPRK